MAVQSTPIALVAKPADAGDRPASKASSARYELIGRLGSGGMGVVFRVFDRVAGEIRALKRVGVDTKHPQHLIEAFEREYQVLASLDHPRIIRVFDYGVDDYGPFYTMELIEGQDMRRVAPLPFKQACLCLRDVATSLALLHSRRLIHRDLSPGNVRMTADGHCKLLDFGALARFGPSSLVIGTPPAIAPEVLAGASLDQRVDLYALGALAYWMLTGTHAYPARTLAELAEYWQEPVPVPSAIVPDIPPDLDALVLALLHKDTLARPETAADVIARLDVIGQLPVEAVAETDRLAQSFLMSPRFTGRATELDSLVKQVAATLEQRGAAIDIQAGAGMGRTRLLDEVAVRALVAGALVLRVDASMARQLYGTARALVLRAFDAAPELASEQVRGHRSALAALGSDLVKRGDTLRPAIKSAPPPGDAEEPLRPLESFFIELSLRRPLVILVDNVEYADDASVGVLAALASQAPQLALMLVATERSQAAATVGTGLRALRSHSRILVLQGLSDLETAELARSLFGGAPNAERFAEWLHARTAGTPLFMVEICRELASKRIIRYSGGLWTLPVERPAVPLPAALADALALRLTQLSEPARSLAECLSLQLEPPTRELLRLLSDQDDLGDKTLDLVAELSRHDVLHASEDGYRFSSTAIRDALLAGMDELRLQRNHRRLGEGLSELADPENPALSLQAGWHLIQGDDALRGADMIAAVASDGEVLVLMVANLHRAGAILEAALQVYTRKRCSIHRRLPLLAALSYAGYYEDRIWGERYGDQALDAEEDLSGLRTARRLRPWLGRWLSLIAGLSIGFIRWQLTPARERPYTFQGLLAQLCASATTLTGAAALSLDSERAASVAEVLEPFSVLPKHFSPVGVYLFCKSLEQIGRENQPAATAMFQILLRRAQDPSYYPSLKGLTRKLYEYALQFAIGGFEIFKADGKLGLASADALDASGVKLYAMIASQLRCLYYTNRGELAKAAPHRARVELYAAQVGSAWQVETWEAPALIVLHGNALSDLVGSTRLVHRLETLSQKVPSLRRYRRLAVHALMVIRGDARFMGEIAHEYRSVAPRAYIGWAATVAHLARGYNEVRQHAEAKAVCEEALAYVTDADREYVSLFSMLDIQLAIAEAGIGETANALARIDRYIERFASCDHPLLHGSLHEARARICWAAGDSYGYALSLSEVERHFRSTRTPALIAKAERLALLSQPRVPANTQHTHPQSQRARALGELPEVSEVETSASPTVERRHS